MKQSLAIKEYQYLEHLINVYGENFSSLYAELKQTVVREELGSGGACMHRGFYCPSPIQDVVIGNVKRGRILKRKPTKCVPEYRFGFDENNQLVIVDKSSDDAKACIKELVIREGDLEIGIGFKHEWRMQWISVCKYIDRKIQSYVYGTCNCSSSEEKSIYISETHREYYSYSQEGLIWADWFDDSWWEGKNSPVMSDHNKYQFYHKKGYLSKYALSSDFYFDKEFLKQHDALFEDNLKMGKLSQYISFEEYEKESERHFPGDSIMVDIKLKRTL